jgi:hypothetical protein
MEVHSLPIQVAGHGNIIFSPHRGHSHILKPTNANEVEMYRNFQKDPNLACLLPWVPQCLSVETNEHGSVHPEASDNASPTFAVNADGEAPHFVELENLLSGFRFPCVLDIKLGAVRWTPTTCPKKVKKIQEKEGPQSSPQLNAFRLCGVHRFGFTTVEDHEQGHGAKVVHPIPTDSSTAHLSRWVAGKDYGRNMDRLAAMAALNAFFSPFLPLSSSSSEAKPLGSKNDHLLYPKELLESVSRQLKSNALDQLQALAAALDHSSILRSYSLTSASLHIAYDATVFLSHPTAMEPPSAPGPSPVPAPTPAVRVHLIDFARCGPLQSRLYFDDSVVRFREGLENLIALLNIMP